jgi:hypothetical protein
MQVSEISFSIQNSLGEKREFCQGEARPTDGTSHRHNGICFAKFSDPVLMPDHEPVHFQCTWSMRVAWNLRKPRRVG